MSEGPNNNFDSENSSNIYQLTANDKINRNYALTNFSKFLFHLVVPLNVSHIGCAMKVNTENQKKFIRRLNPSKGYYSTQVDKLYNS